MTGIEFISPTNKADHRARESYIKKRQELIEEGSSLVEVDLLRGGRALVALPPSESEMRGPDDYLANIVRAGGEEYEYYLTSIRDPLPRVAVPLRPGDDDAVLDLTEAVARAFEGGDYEGRLLYDRDPVPPLASTNSAWADALLIEEGRRPPKT